MPATEDLLLRFTPHIPRRACAAGWTADRQVAFIAALARSGVVSHAARSVGMSPRSAYQLRATVRRRYSNWSDVPMTPERAEALGPGYIYSFAAAWDKALDRGLALQIEAAAPVALEGEQVPVIRRGRIIGWQTKFNTRLALTALGAFRRYTDGLWFDHQFRIERNTENLASRIDAFARLGPVVWPEAAPEETYDERRARRRRERREERLYGPRRHGMLDPGGPADRPPRTLDEQAGRLPPCLPAPPRAPVQPRVRLL